MLKLLFSTVLLICFQGGLAQKKAQECHRFREIPYSTLVPFQDEKSALTLSASNSAYYQNISGGWQAKGSGGVGNRNGANAFVSGFTPPKEWARRQTYLCFPILRVPIRVTINGEMVEELPNGLPAKLNISSFLKDSVNQLEIAVLGTQQPSLLTGVSDSVYMISGAQQHLKDLGLYGGLLAGNIPRQYFPYTYFQQLLKNNGRKGWKNWEHQYSIQLHGEAGESTRKHEFKTGIRGMVIAPGKETTITTSVPSTPYKMWNAETPYLYSMVLSTADSAGKTQEVYALKAGLRLVQLKGQDILLNFKQVRLYPTLIELPPPGTVLAAGYFEDLVKQLKLHNVNTVVVAGDPLPHTRLYELCDQYGLYAVQRLDLDSDTVINDKAAAIIHMLKNHASLLAWTVGAEGAGGTLPAVLADTIEEISPGRPLLHENSLPAIRQAPRWGNLDKQGRLRLMRAYQRVGFLLERGTDSTSSSLRISNMYDFSPLDGVTLDWQVKGNGATIKEGHLADIIIRPGGVQTFVLPIDINEYRANPQVTFSFSIRLTENPSFAGQDHQIAQENFTVISDKSGALTFRKTLP